MITIVLLSIWLGCVCGWIVRGWLVQPRRPLWRGHGGVLHQL
jgi:hypothetical protein